MKFPKDETSWADLAWGVVGVIGMCAMLSACAIEVAYFRGLGYGG